MDLHTLFNPSSIAVIGVSYDPKKVGYLVAKNLLEQGYKNSVYFINKKAEGDILGKKVYSSLSEITEAIDLAVLAIPAEIALTSLDEIHAKGIKNVVLFAAGFKEVGEEGKKNEELLIQKTKEYGINLLGPNCIGYVNTHLGVNTTFLKSISPVGNIGFVSQSGALGSVLVDYFASHKNLGFSYFISLGNKTVVDESSSLEFLAQDPNTEVVGMYLEDVKDGKKFRELLRSVSLKKPVVILKSGSTEQGSKAAVSHTGGMVGNDQVYDAIFKQCGAIRAESFTEFLTILKIYSFKKAPVSKEMLVLSNAGGVGVLYADDIVKAKLDLLTVSEETIGKLKSTVGEVKKISLHNPIDLLGDASAFEYKEAIESTLNERSVGAISVLLTPQANTQIAETAKAIHEVQQHFDKPLYPVFMGDSSVKDAHTFFEEQKIVSFDTYDDVTKSVAKILWRQEFITSSEAHDVGKAYSLSLRVQEQEITTLLSKNNGKPFLNLRDSLRILELQSIPVTPMNYIESEQQLQEISKGLQYPVVAKIASDVITHKTEVSGVKTHIMNSEELAKTFQEFTATGKSKGMYIQEMVKGYEVFIGAKRDPHFGVVIVVGIGGIYTELFKEISYRVFPFSKEEFNRMVGETKLDRLLKGFRGSVPIASAGIYEIVMKLGVLMEHFNSIKEVDINPLFITDKHAVVVDCRVVFDTENTS